MLSSRAAMANLDDLRDSRFSELERLVESDLQVDGSFSVASERTPGAGFRETTFQDWLVVSPARRRPSPARDCRTRLRSCNRKPRPTIVHGLVQRTFSSSALLID